MAINHRQYLIIISTGLLIIHGLISRPVVVYGQAIAGDSAQLNYIAESIKIASSSEHLVPTQVPENYFIKKMAIKKVLEKYNSPLINSLDSFIDSCKDYDLDCYLLPSIAGLESTFGKFILPDSYNPFGWGGGYILFQDWNEAIQTVGKGLRENYINKGSNSIDDIGHIYSESSTWAVRVNIFINEFKMQESRNQLFFNNE
jgi:hypothetical protein